MAAWNAIGLVTGAFSLVAFIAAAAYWSYRHSLLATERLVASVPEAERANVLEDFFQSVHVDTSNLTREQKYQLAREIIAARTKATQQKAAVIAFLALMAGVVAVFALSRPIVTGDERGSSGDSPPPSLSKFLLKGQIRDEFSGEPIEGASISIRNNSAQDVETDSYGHFSFQFSVTETEPLIRIQAAAEGYRTAIETLRLQEPTSTWDRSLRSVAAEELRQLVGRWEASSNEDGLKEHYSLALTALEPPELRGKFRITVSEFPSALQPQWQEPPQWGQPVDPPECSAEGQAILSHIDGSIWMRISDFRPVHQGNQVPNCGLSISASAEDEPIKVSIMSSAAISIEPSPPDDPLVLRRAGAPLKRR